MSSGSATGLTLPLGLALMLAAGHLVWSLVDALSPADPATTYVFTPLVDVWPDGPPLSAEEGAALGRELRHGAEARNISQAYARLGSTLSLAELLVGVQALDAEGALTAQQRTELTAVLDAARSDHDALVQLQRRILEQEAAVAQAVAEVRSARTGSTP